MLNIFICEDMRVQLSRINNMITEYIRQKGIKAKIIAAKEDPEDILAALHDAHKPALFFIDVQLDGYKMDGFHLARQLKSIDCEYGIVFLTSNAHMAYKAFEYRLEILDYIVKKPEYFWQEEVHEYFIQRLDYIFEKSANLCNKKRKLTITLCGRGKVTDVVIDDIVFVQSVAGKHLAEVYLSNRMITVRQSIKSIYGQLGEGFVYVNKSCIVNKNKMQELDKKERFLYLDGGGQVEVSFRELRCIEEIFRNDNTL